MKVLNLNITAGRFAHLCGCLFFAAVLLQPAKADTIQFGGLNFTLTNTNSDGQAGLIGSTLVIIGPNNGSGDSGTTDLTATAPGAGTVSFSWMYSSLDTPGYDYAGYSLGGSFVQLADTSGESGSTQFSVTSGETFGFEVASLDNEGEAGIFDVLNFSAPAGQPATAPEPTTFSLFAFAAATGVGLFYGSKRTLRPQE